MSRTKVVALIPARGGSKGIPGKNIKNFLGRPLIDYTIGHARADPLVDLVVVSTDSDQIADRANTLGVRTIVRPEAIAEDDTPDLPVFLHALDVLVGEGHEPDWFVHLRATSPLRPPGAIGRAVGLAVDAASPVSVRSVSPAAQNPFKMWTIGAAGELSPLFESVGGIKEPYSQPRQLLPRAFWQTAVIDVVPTSVLMSGSMTGPHVLPLDLGPYAIIDLDTEEDWTHAEAAASGLRHLLIHRA